MYSPISPFQFILGEFVLDPYLFEQRQDVVELGARVSLEEPLEVRVHCGPGRRLLLRVIDARYRLAAEIRNYCSNLTQPLIQ